MLQKTDITGYFVRWKSFSLILILMCVILFFTLLYQQNYGNPNTDHILYWSMLQKASDEPEYSESFSDEAVPSRETILSTAEGSRLTATEILAPVAAEPNVSAIQEPVWGEDHIIFLETSCILKEGEAKPLLPRQICSIESAARINSSRKVYILHSCPLPVKDLGIGPVYSKYSNIKFWPLNLDHLMPGSPLEGWDYRGHLRQSKWPREHGSDIARFLVLWNYGGSYFDTDVMLIREFSGVTKENFISQEKNNMGSAALRFLAHNETAHQLLRTVMMQVRNDFRGWEWIYNGPGALQRAVLELCKTTTFGALPSSCLGVNLLSSKYFFEIPYTDWKMFFDESRTQQVMSRIKDSYGVHFWNNLSHETKVLVGSRQAYALLAQEHCPHLYTSVESSF